MNRTPALLVSLMAAAVISGCDNMWHQDHYRAYDPSTHFADGAASRTPPAHTVKAGDPSEAAWSASQRIPVPVTADLLRRGRECFNAQCSECHGEDGYGRGIVVLRGFPPPPSLHDPRLRATPDGHIWDVIVRGYGIMYPAGYRVAPNDRWAIVAYIRAMQFSQHAFLSDLAAADRARFTRP